MEKAQGSELNHKVGSFKRNKKIRNPASKRRNKVAQPRLPKTASEVSSNWKALSLVLAADKKPQKDIKRKRSESKFLKSNKRKTNLNQFVQEKQTKDAKTENKEIWFDDVDLDDIERATGRKLKRFNEVENELINSTSSVSAASTQINDIQDNLETQTPRTTKYVGMDCEFVGIGKNGTEHMLARVSIVNSDGDVLYDQFVAPQERVIDYRTDVSGVRYSDLKKAPNFKEVQNDVAAIIKNKTLVGHAIKTDLKVLFLDHPRKHIRDTAKYKPFQQRMKTKHPSLKKLAKEILSLSIQTGEHSSVEDARAAMQLYREHRKQWEKSIKENFRKSIKIRHEEKKL